MYAIGLPAFGFIKVFSLYFFQKNTFIPFVISTFAMLVNLFLIVFLIDKMGHLGIALVIKSSKLY